MTYILSIDQGTTGTTAMLVDAKSLKPVGKVNTEFTQYFPQNSWVEHDLNEIWETVKISCLGLFSKTLINPSDIISIGITNQRETLCAFDKSGTPLARAIVWQDRRTQAKCQELKKSYEHKKLKLKTGLPLDPYFSATKINWLLENNLKVQDAQKNENLLFSTIDSFLLFKLTNNKSFFTDATMASRTLLMNHKSCKWDQELLDFFQIPLSTLPDIKPTLNHFGKTQNSSFLPDGIAIDCLIGDQQSALLGQKCTREGQLKCTYGTGAFLLLNTGQEICYSDNGLLTTVALQTNQKTYYALEGSTYIAGAAIQWLRDNLNFFDKSIEVEALIDQCNQDEMSDIYFFPFFTGLGTPHWDSNAKAAIVGMTRATEKKHIALAALEGIALSVNDTIEVFKKDSSKELINMKVDGGASLNNKLMEIQSKFSKIDIERPEHIETTALGAAYGAYLNHHKLDLDGLDSLTENADRVFQKINDDSKYTDTKLKFWKDYIEKNFKS